MLGCRGSVKTASRIPESWNGCEKQNLSCQKIIDQNKQTNLQLLSFIGIVNYNDNNIKFQIIAKIES